METMEQKETKAILSMAEAINALSQQLSDANHQLQLANERIGQLESIVYRINKVEVQ